MNRTRHRARRAAELALAAGAAAVLLTACSSGTDKDGDDVASLRTSDSSTAAQDSGTGTGKKYKAGSKEASKAFDEWKAKFRTCVARKAEQLGIEVVEGTGKNEGDLVAKGLGGSRSETNGNVTYDNPLTKKWWEEVDTPCRKEIPVPEVEDDKSDPAKLAEIRKKYECLRKEGLDGLHEPTIDDPSLFTGEGTKKYLGGNPDPKAEQALKKCGIG
ncbi:hypothetical protein ACWD4B_02765 [Streptomyces sp. NPDC002536]